MSSGSGSGNGNNKAGRNANDAATSTSSNDTTASLPKLLSALALGARAVHGLPMGDEFSFQSSFPEFHSLLQSNHSELLQALSIALEDPSLIEVSTTDTQDPIVWEKCADACDALIESVEAHLLLKSSSSLQATEPLQQWSRTARLKSRGSYARIVAGIVEMEKPQVTYHIKPQNDRLKPFVPPIREKPHAKVPLNLELQPGNGWSSRYGKLQKGNNLLDPASIVAPSHHVPHVYSEEIKTFEYQPWQLEAPSTKPCPLQKESQPLQATWVDTVQNLEKLSVELQNNNVKEVAIDLEAHSYRSFAGITCLMQLSFVSIGIKKQYNYLVDTLKLWHSIQKYLGPTFCNPNVVKVMHGADSDVQWLQRDFGIYIVNLFDTGRACRLLKLSSAGLAHLLEKYVVGLEAVDKSFQLSDWRQRPLPNEERQYAIMDTHYLLGIYHCLQYDLEAHPSPDVSIRAVLDASRQVCLIRYDKEPFKPMGYKSLMSSSSSGRNNKNKKTKTDLTEKQERVLKALYDWRDETARETDESLHYVCSNQGLLRLALSCPITVATLQTCMNPMPPLVLQCAQGVLDIIKRASVETISSTPASNRRPLSSAYFKPAKETEVEDEGELRRATGMSPVLGTEALYKQAGWMTPQGGGGGVAAEAATTTTTTTTDEDDNDHDATTSKPRHLLMVNSANKGFCAVNNYTMHSLEMSKKGSSSSSKTADGLGAARAAAMNKDDDATSVAPLLLEEESERAQQSAARIRTEQAKKQNDLLVGMTNTIEEGADDNDEAEEVGKEVDVVNEDDFEIPQSMSEIYKISNRNRRKNKKTSPPSQRANVGMVAHTKPLPVDTLEGAEAVLAKAGLNGMDYFASDNKRQRTKQENGADDANEGTKDGGNTRADDITFMEQIGWVKNRQELEAMVMDRRREDDDVEKDEEQKVSKPAAQKDSKPAAQAPPSTFDYSSVGSIGVFHPNAPQASNPFFAGAAVAGGSLGSSRGPPQYDRKKSNNNAAKEKSARSSKQERHEKKDGRSFAYRKR